MEPPSRERHTFKNLDAFRFFSFFAVFLSHAGPPGILQADGESATWMQLGRLGVDCFFVLSGFLITWLALKERKATGRFNLGYFQVRRILRIWPMYFLLIGIAFIVVAVQHASGRHVSVLPPWPWLVSFTLNLYISHYGPGFLFFLVFLWSVAVEEQFYLAWGIMFRFIPRMLEAMCFVLLAGSIVFRAMNFPDSNCLYFHSLSAAGDFALGALLAKHSFTGSGIFRRLADASKFFWASCYGLLVISLAFYPVLFRSAAMVSVERAWFGLLFTLLLAEQTFATKPLLRYGKWNLVNRLGVISYGLYCYHGIALTLSAKLIVQTCWWLPPVLFLFTTFVAMASYRFFEQPFLALKQRFYPAP